MSDFGRILQEWERRQAREREASAPRQNSDRSLRDTATGQEAQRLESVQQVLRDWIDRYPPTPEHKEEEHELDQPRPSPSVEHLPPEDTLDLHGHTQREARRRIRRFLAESASRGLVKVLIVHGKGYHSSDREPILKRVTYEELQSNPLAGRIGVPPRELGGRGAVWVAVRQRSR